MRTIIPGQNRPAPAPRDPDQGEAAILSPQSDGFAAAPAEPDIEAPRANGALSRDQKTRLSILARSVYDRDRGLGLIDEGTRFDDWRHAECLTATGGRVGGFREATNRDYRQLRGHFANLAGDGATAIQDAISGDPERADWEQAWAILRRECQRRGHAFPEYPASICRPQYKCPLREASTKQLWSLIYTVRNRTKKKTHHP